MNEVFFPATKHSSLGNEFLVCLLTEDDAKEDVAESTADIPPVEEAHRYFENLRLQGKWNADGLVLAWEDKNLIEKISKENDTWRTNYFVHMRLFNADGSEAEISGNGLCCLGQAIARHKVDSNFSVDVAIGGSRQIVTVENGFSEASASAVTTTMNYPMVGAFPVRSRLAQAAVANEDLFSDIDFYQGYTELVDVGNPHLVIMVEKVDGLDVARHGKAIEDQVGPINIEFVNLPVGVEPIDMVIWERGVGVTQSCGSGAVAVAAVVDDFDMNFLEDDDYFIVNMPGGSARVDLLPESRKALYTTTVKYLGEYDPA